MKNNKMKFLVFILLMVILSIKVFLFSTYESKAMLMVDMKQRTTSVDSERISLEDSLGPMRIHQELLLSDPVLRKVVVDLKLYEDTRGLFLQIWDKTGDSDLKKERLIREMIECLRSKNITITSPPFTNLIVVKARYKNAQKSADIVNVLIKDYIKWHISFNHNEVDNLINYLEQEVKEAHERLAKSEEDLEGFKVDNHIVDIQEEVKAYLQIMPEEFRAQYQDVHNGQIQVLGMQNAINLEMQRSLLENKKVIVAKLLDLEVALMRLRELYTDESSQVKFMKGNIQQLKDEIEGVDRQIKANAKKSNIFIDDISVRIKQQKNAYKIDDNYWEHFKGMPQRKMWLERFERAVRINDSQYAFLVNELQKAKLINAKETTEDIKIVSQAQVPLKIQGMVTGLLVGCFLSFVFSFGIPLIYENRKVIIG